MEKQTDKGLVIGLFVENEPPKAPEVKKSVVTEEVPVEVVEEAEAPTVEAEVVTPEEAPRRGRGRPRKIID